MKVAMAAARVDRLRAALERIEGALSEVLRDTGLESREAMRQLRLEYEDSDRDGPDIDLGEWAWDELLDALEAARSALDEDDLEVCLPTAKALRRVQEEVVFTDAALAQGLKLWGPS